VSARLARLAALLFCIAVVAAALGVMVTGGGTWTVPL
jgi:hypothetical protein